MLLPGRPIGVVGPIAPPIITEPGFRPGPDLVPVVQCGTNALGRRFVTISVRNEGSEPAPRSFVVDYTISGTGFISGRFPVSSLRPGQQMLLESTADNVLQGIRPIFITVQVDPANRIPEDTNKSNNRVLVRCFPTPIVQSGAM